MSDALLVCRCGAARSPAGDDVGDWITRLHSGDGHKVATDRHRAECSPPSGCRRCGEPMQGRFLFYCGVECRHLFESDHWWTQARSTALKFVRDPDGYYGWSPSAVCAQVDDTCEGKLEVNHIEPVNGDRQDWSCQNHQSNLEPLCHSHHVRETNAQKRDGRIGTPESAARLREHDELAARRREKQEAAAAMNPPLL